MNLDERFCARCGAWEGEYMACEESDCGPLMTRFELDVLRDFETLARAEEIAGKEPQS